MRVFLAAHGPGHAAAGIEQAGFLGDTAAILDNFDLTARLVFDCLMHEADGIHILDFATCPQLAARPAH